jgi:hypothetical protein
VAKLDVMIVDVESDHESCDHSVFGQAGTLYLSRNIDQV